jgi:CheY-like chemotaxis protein
VVERAGQLFGLQVDEILDTLSTSASVDRSLNQGRIIVGNIAEKDQLIVVIDPFELIGKCFGNSNHEQALQVMNQIFKANQPQGAKTKDTYEILLAEDLPFFRKVVKEVLEKHGYKVSLAGDGSEAWSLLQHSTSTFDLLVTDIEMPKKNGFELAKMIRADSRLSHLPILALSSRFDSKHTDEAAKVGIDFYLEKMSPENLLKAVEGLITFKRGAA